MFTVFMFILIEVGMASDYGYNMQVDDEVENNMESTSHTYFDDNRKKLLISKYILFIYIIFSRCTKANSL